jgi:hypothetical protein
MQYIKDKINSFDDYFPSRKKEKKAQTKVCKELAQYIYRFS